MGQLEVAMRERHPFPGRAWIWLKQMNKRNAGTQASPITPIEIEKVPGGLIFESFATLIRNVLADPASTEDLTLQGKEG
jgi:hypothetical protein